MQRQDNVLFLCHPSIFMAMARHLTPASMAVLVQTCKLARFRVEQVLSHPEAIVAMLENWSVAETAQFFRHYHHQISDMVCQKLAANPDHLEANILHYLMCNVTPKVIDLDKLTGLISHLKANAYPRRFIKSLEFIAAILQTDMNNLQHLFANERDYYLNLRGANLVNAVLSGCNLSHANLRGANLMSADLRQANLFAAELDHTTLTLADCDGANFIDASMGNIHEEFGFPHEPKLKNAAFFAARDKQTMTKTLHRFHHMENIPDFLIDAIAEDFTHAHSETSYDEQLAVLEDGLHDPLFATHSAGIVAFINRNLFTIFTHSQDKISQQIAAVKLVKDLEDDAAEFVMKSC